MAGDVSSASEKLKKIAVVSDCCGEAAAFSFLASHFDFAAGDVENPLDKGESKSVAFLRVAPVALVEFLEDVLLGLFAHAAAGIAHFYLAESAAFF